MRFPKSPNFYFVLKVVPGIIHIFCLQKTINIAILQHANTVIILRRGNNKIRGFVVF